jgi:hypothetical protein
MVLAPDWRLRINGQLSNMLELARAFRGTKDDSERE